MKLFKEGARFYKGNLHCHTTESDGCKTPEEAIEIYRAMGYDFLALTDHRVLSEPTHLDGDMLLLAGLEMDFMFPAECLHLIGIGMEQAYAGSKEYRRGPQACIDAMRAHGGRVIVAHPAWSLNTVATLSALRNITAAEMYNSVSTVPWNGERADSGSVLDVAAAHGAFFNFVASDDSHWYQGEQGRSFTMVQAEALTQEGIFKALDAGHFYASQGPTFEQITVEDRTVKVRCSPVEVVVFYSNLVWAHGRCTAGSGRTEAEYSLDANEGESFVRVQLIDAQGKKAWSNPILL